MSSTSTAASAASAASARDRFPGATGSLTDRGAHGDRADRGDHAAPLRRAAELGDAGAHGAALAAIDAALRTATRAAELHAARGWALENVDPPRWTDAADAYATAIRLDPRQLWAKVGLATALGRLGQAAACPALYADAAAEAAGRAAREPELIELIGWCQFRLGQPDAAAASFARALAIDPDAVSVRFDLGLLLLQRGDDGAAAQYAAGIRSLAARPPAQRAEALRLALDDLDDAVGGAAGPAPLPADRRRAQVRGRLAGALQEARGDV